ncbi:MAG: P-loop NTPase fold protein [Acidobacteriota bacterium]
MSFLHNDEPILFGGPSAWRLVSEIGHAVADCAPPQVFGIHGNWGVGKTSFLHGLHWYLTGNCPQQPDHEVKAAKAELEEARLASPDLSLDEPGITFQKAVTVVWFEAWRYQHEEVPIVPLLHEMRAHLSWTAKARRKAANLGSTAVRSALLALEDITKMIGIQASKIQEAGEQWERENLAVKLPSHVAREQLEAAVGALLGRHQGKPRRLVILVDDLDRCEPEMAYRFLEGIKIYLNLPSCVFVLGMNQQIIEEAIAPHLSFVKPGEDGKAKPAHRHKAHEYIEKICQNIWHLPLVARPHEMLRDLLEKAGEEAEIIDPLCAVVQHYGCLPPIPRRIKAFANLIGRRRGHLKQVHATAQQEPIATSLPSSVEPWAAITIAFAYLYTYHQVLYRILRDQKRFFYSQLLSWCENPAEPPTPEGEKATGSRDDPPEVLRGLQPTHERLVVDPSAPTPRLDWQPCIADPAAFNLFRIQRLLFEIGDLDEAVIEALLD